MLELTSFISQHPCLIEGKPEDMNILVLTALCKHYDSLDGSGARRRFVELLPTNSPCIPFDSDDSKKWQTAVPKDLYLPSSDLSAFAGVGVFNKVSTRLSKCSDAFLLALGVVSFILCFVLCFSFTSKISHLTY